MNKTLNINLAGFIFHIDEDAYKRLEKYLNTLKAQFAKTEGGREIISDIETRIAELFKERTGEQKEVINAADVDQVIAIMGQPEDYLDLTDEPKEKAPEIEFTTRKKRIYRDSDNRIIAGVAAGVAAYFNVDTIWIRLAFVLLFMGGFGFLFYLIMWLIIPKAQSTAEKLQMRGEKVNISNIEKSIRDEMKGFGDKVSNIDYKKSGNHLSSFFTDLGDFIVDAFRIIFKVIGKLFGLVFLVFGFAILATLGIGLFAGGVEIMGSGYGLSDLFDFFELITVSNGHYNLLVAGIILSVIAPIFFLLYFGIRILFDLEPLNGPTRSGLVLTTFLGLIFILISGVKIGTQFEDGSEVYDDFRLKPAQQYVLTLKQDSIGEQFSQGEAASWIHDDEMNVFNLVFLDIRKAKGDKAYLKVTSNSQGRSYKSARYNARETKFELVIKDSIIYLPNYFELKKGQKFRGQHIDVVLYLPDSNSVYIDESVVEMLDDVENVQGKYDRRMGKTVWDMTDKGLSCRGCEIPEDHEDGKYHEEGFEVDFGDGFEVDFEGEEDDNIQWDDSTSIERLEIKMDKDGFRLKIEDKEGQSREKKINLYSNTDMDELGSMVYTPFRRALEAVI